MTTPITQDDIASLLISNTERVFSVMLGMCVTARTTRIDQDAQGQDGGVVALVGFVGQWVGTGSVSCSSQMACKLSSKMLLADYPEVNEEVLDAMGEITNMIVGNFKDAAEPILGPMGLSTPTVIYGDSFRTRNMNGKVWTTVPFECEGETIEVKICVEPSHESRIGSNAPTEVTGAECR